MAIAEYLNSVDVVVALIGRGWSSSRLEEANDPVRLELTAALRSDTPIIPILVDDTEMPTPNQLPDELTEMAYFNALRVRPDPDFRDDATHLAHAVRLAAERSRAATTSPPGGPALVEPAQMEAADRASSGTSPSRRREAASRRGPPTLVAAIVVVVVLLGGAALLWLLLARGTSSSTLNDPLRVSFADHFVPHGNGNGEAAAGPDGTSLRLIDSGGEPDPGVGIATRSAVNGDFVAEVSYRFPAQPSGHAILGLGVSGDVVVERTFTDDTSSYVVDQPPPHPKEVPWDAEQLSGRMRLESKGGTIAGWSMDGDGPTFIGSFPALSSEAATIEVKLWGEPDQPAYVVVSDFELQSSSGLEC